MSSNIPTSAQSAYNNMMERDDLYQSIIDDDSYTPESWAEALDHIKEYEYGEIPKDFYEAVVDGWPSKLRQIIADEEKRVERLATIIEQNKKLVEAGFDEQDLEI